MGLNAVIGILLALLHRDRTGTGQAIAASLYDAAVTLLHPQAANYLMSGDVPQAKATPTRTSARTSASRQPPSRSSSLSAPTGSSGSSAN